MFEDLSRKLDGVLGRFRQRGLLTEPMIREGLREVRRALLEADVNFKVAKNFIQRVKEQALGQQVLKSLTPGQQLVKVIHRELVALLGGNNSPPNLAEHPPTIGMLVGRAMEALGRNPEARAAIQTNMILGVAFAEAIGIYALLTAIIIAFVI